MSPEALLDIKPVEIDGSHWVRTSVNGMEMDRRGPLPNATEARMTVECTGARWRQGCRKQHPVYWILTP